jgi:hypothetical protein
VSGLAPEIVALIEAYMAATNRRDLDGVRATLHFPHVLFSLATVTSYPTAADFSFAAFDARTAGQGWSHSTFDSHGVLMSGPDKVHLDIEFTRWRADGSKIGTYHAMYTVIRIDGRWGILARSSQL